MGSTTCSSLGHLHGAAALETMGTKLGSTTCSSLGHRMVRRFVFLFLVRDFRDGTRDQDRREESVHVRVVSANPDES